MGIVTLRSRVILEASPGVLLSSAGKFSVAQNVYTRRSHRQTRAEFICVGSMW
jgi:hypothetical protein